MCSSKREGNGGAQIKKPREIRRKREGERDNNNNNNNRTQRRYSRLFTISSQRRSVSNTYAQVARAQSCANHVQHIERLSRASVMLRATWYEGTAQLLSLTELKSHLFDLYFIG